MLNSKIALFLTLYMVATFVTEAAKTSYSQSTRVLSDLKFKTLSTIDGLPTNEVQKTFQDKEGFIWFATRSGLCKYDGYTILTYNSNQHPAHSLPSNNIFCIDDDSNYNLWIGTYNGISRFNKQSGKFEQIEIQNTTNKVVYCLSVTKDNDIWIGMDDGLFKYDTSKNIFTHHSIHNIGNDKITAPVKSIYEDSKGEIWIGTWNSGLYRYSSSKNVLYSYPILNPRNSAHVVFEDSMHNIWVGTWDNGLHLLENPYEIENLKIRTFKHNKNDSTSLSDNIVYDICEDLNTNSLWIGTRSGLSILDYNNPIEFINYSSDHKTNRLPTNEINSITRDNEGSIWVGTIGGGTLFTNTEASKFDFIEPKLPDIPTGSIKSIFLDSKDNTWFGLGTYGVALLDSNNNIYSQQELFEFKDLGLNTIYDIKQRNDKEILFATYGNGLWVYSEGKTTNTYTVDNCNFISDNRIRSIYIDNHQKCWIGTQYGLGVWSADGSGFVFDKININGNNLEHASVIDITEDKKGKIWVATIDNGVISIERKSDNSEDYNFKNYNIENNKLTSNTISSLLSDSKGRLWAGATSGKLYLYDEQVDSFIDKSPQFSILGNLINSIQEDTQGSLWLGTNRGLTRLTFDESSILINYRVYTVVDGLQDNFFISRSSFKHKDELFFGSYKGITRFTPNQIKENIESTPFFITDIQISNTSFSNLDNEVSQIISDKTPTFLNKITIPHKYNNFSIHFASLNYKNPDLNRYAYKLDGFDQDWTYADSKQNFVFYNNLSAGRYKFKLRATSQNGIWNDETKEILVKVLPPFWLSWWAYLLYFIIFITIIYSIYKNIVHRIHLHEQLRYKEIEQEKTQELNHAKLQFFTNITHELLTPLTIISASVDELKMTSPRKDNLYGTMGNNINRLTRLLQQILEFRKAESGNLKLKVSYGNISEFIRRSTGSFIPIFKKKKLHFSFISHPENIQGFFDNDKLDKILYNLISNAVKYVDEGGTVNSTLSYHDDEDSSFIKLSVKDNGAGISKENQKTLFKRFYDGDYRRHNTVGTGIGLSLVKDIVELYHGTIKVDSEVDQGSEFIITLPIDISYFDQSEIDKGVYQQLHHSISTQKANPEDTIYETDEKNQLRNNLSSVLIVEDNEEILEFIERLMIKNYKVSTATNGKEALVVLEHESIDLIISDIIMPEMDGVELCKYLKANIEYSHIPIILLTAKTDAEDRTVAYESGADAFITKPFSLGVLQARIKNLLKNRERVAREFKNQLVIEIKDLNFTNIDEEFIQNAIDSVNRNLDNSNFDQQMFADELNVSKSTLYNKLRTLTGLNTSAFITNIRLKAACQIMNKNQNIRISDLAYAVGFNDPKYFSSCFKKEFKMRPSEYLEQLTNPLQK